MLSCESLLNTVLGAQSKHIGVFLLEHWSQPHILYCPQYAGCVLTSLQRYLQQGLDHLSGILTTQLDKEEVGVEFGWVFVSAQLR